MEAEARGVEPICLLSSWRACGSTKGVEKMGGEGRATACEGVDSTLAAQLRLCALRKMERVEAEGTADGVPAAGVPRLLLPRNDIARVFDLSQSSGSREVKTISCRCMRKANTPARLASKHALGCSCLEGGRLPENERIYEEKA